jgi:hypothetical protein
MTLWNPSLWKVHVTDEDPKKLKQKSDSWGETKTSANKAKERVITYLCFSPAFGWVAVKHSILVLWHFSEFHVTSLLLQWGPNIVLVWIAFLLHIWEIQLAVCCIIVTAYAESIWLYVTLLQQCVLRIICWWLCLWQWYHCMLCSPPTWLNFLLFMLILRRMKQLLENNLHCVILTSGTLSPLPSLMSELGIPIPVTLENPHVIGSGQVFVSVISTGPDGFALNSSYNTRCDLDSKFVLVTLLSLSMLLYIFLCSEWKVAKMASPCLSSFALKNFWMDFH